MKLIEDTQLEILKEYEKSIREINKATKQFKAEARTTLQAKLAFIGARRSIKQSSKAKKVYKAMEQYRQEVSAVNQRNTKVKTSLYRLLQKAILKLLRIKKKWKGGEK